MAERQSKPDETHSDPYGATDNTLISKYLQGHDQAATELYLRYTHRLHGLVKSQKGIDLAARLDAEDVVQSVFRTFFRRAAAGHYQVPEGEELWKLFLVIALNKIRTAATYHRAAKRDVRRTASSDASEKLLEVPATRDDMALSVLQIVIEEVLATLPPTHRRLVELRIEGCEVAEIARTTGRARRTVERVLQQFRDRLQAEINAE